ncbi:hypothetical protein ACRN9G_03710 [Shewanella frigidimarina]|uniref:hypothetical protein n=1 Tax=Shewanella frigidimarina TaxID=56812 RepID=UPI003D793BA8
MILSRPFNNGELIDFDNSTSTFKSVINIGEKPKGNFHLLGQRKVAIFSDDNLLILQIGEKKWNLSSEDVVLRYSHNCSKKMTTFEVESDGQDISVEYEAWWAGIPSFEPIEPEMDEDEDFMGYVYAVWMNKVLQQKLISSWS